MAAACDFPEELVEKPLGYVCLAGLDAQNNAMHRSIWDTFTLNRRQEKVLNIQSIPGDKEFPKRKQKQRASYEFYLPKGILKRNWMKKHLHGLPALVVVFYDLDWNDPQWREKQTECASRVAVIRSSLYGRNSRIAVVLIQKNMPLPPGEDPQAVQRAESLCQACELTSKSLFVLPFSDHLHGYVTRLEGAFYEIAQVYYTNEAKYVKLHKELLNKSQHQLLFVRHQFKIAFYSELKQDPHNALKHYKQSYQYLLEQRLTDINNLEVKLCAGFLNYKICKISFQVTAPLDAISQFRKHIDFYKSKVGPPELLFEHSAWMAQHLFGDLFQEAIKNGLNAIQTQHPGFYYQQAANHTMQRRKHCKALCQYSEPVQSDPLQGKEYMEYYGQRPWRPGCQANEAPDPAMEQAGILSIQANELNVEHYYIVIPLLSSAVNQFREYKSVRMKLYLMSQMGEEYFEAKDYTKSLTLLNRVAPFYRGERWWKLLSNVLTTSLKCAYLTASVQDYITISLEMIGKYSLMSNEDKTRIQMNLLRIAKNTIPDSEHGCPEEAVENAVQLWKEKLQKEDKTVYTIDMENLASFIECRASVEGDSFHLDEMASIEVYLRSVSMFPLHFSEVGLKFSNSSYNKHCVRRDDSEHKGGESDLYLEPGKVNIQKFSFILASTDVNEKLEIKNVYLNLGDNIVLMWKGAGLDANVGPMYDSSNYGGERLPVKMTADGNVAWETVTISPFTDVLQRPALITLTADYNVPALVDEYFPVHLKIDNKEKSAIQNTRMTVKEKDPPENAIDCLYLDQSDGGNNLSPLKKIEFELQEILPDSAISKTVYVRINEMGKKTFIAETIYNVEVSVGESIVNCTCSKELTLEVDVQIPFSVSVKLANTRYQQINDLHMDEPFCLVTYVKCTSPWPLDIQNSEIIPTKSIRKQENSPTSQLSGLQLKEGDIASECHCIVAPLNNEYEQKEQSAILLGQYSIQWKRNSSDRYVSTIVKLPTVTLNYVPIYVETDLPTYGCVYECMESLYTVHNRTSMVLEVEVAIKPSDVFMLSGNNRIQFRVLPRGQHKLAYNLFPLVCGELPLPEMHVNITQFPNIDHNAIVKNMLRTHVFVKVPMNMLPTAIYILCVIYPGQLARLLRKPTK